MIENEYNTLTIHLTNQCPMMCKHCGPESGPHEKGKLNSNTVFDAIIEATRRGCYTVNFTGGEPFILKEDLENYVEFASKLGFFRKLLGKSKISQQNSMM